jgi:hypothetical protein
MRRLALVTSIALILVAQGGGTHLGLLANVAAQTPSSTMQDMKKMHEQMMAEMKAGDAKLDALVSDMNAAADNAKVNAVAAVVTELVRQHKAMHAHMGRMHRHMMGGRGMMMKE